MSNQLRPQTAVIQTRLDIRVLAALADSLEAEGKGGETRAGLVQVCLYTLHEALVKSGAIKPYADSSAAYERLVDLGYEGAKQGQKTILVPRNFSAQLGVEQSNRAEFEKAGLKPSDEAKELLDEME